MLPARPAVVAGAGLVGSLAAIYLRRRGERVVLVERLPDMRRERVAAGRSINLAISERGLNALRRVGLEGEARAHAIPMRGRVMHSVRGELSFQPYGKDDSQHINSLSRGVLNQILMTAAEREGVEIEFNRRLTGVDFEGRTLRFEDRAGDLGYEVLFGADGAGSVVRQELQKRPGFAFHQELLGHGYKELTLPAAPGETWRIEKHALHIWPRGSYMLIALPNEDGSFTCTLFLPYEGPQSFAALQDGPAVRAFFAREFPDALALLPDLEHQFFGNPTGHMGTIRGKRWHLDGSVLLLGDAAHAIVPFYGQGMNCGFEDCVALEALLGEGADRAAAFEAFSARRAPQAEAIADMALENFVEMRDLVGDPRFILRKQVEKVLLNAFPDRFLSRYTLVSFSLAPYMVALRVGELASAVVAELSEGLTRAEDVDLGRAEQLIAAKLVPYLKEHAHELGA